MRRPLPFALITALALTGFCLIGRLPAKTLLLPVEAVEDSRYVTLEDFRLLYPGIDISGYTPDEEGWYVRYRHENLTYYFGPVSDHAGALRHKRRLEKIRHDVIRKRESLASSEIVLYQFSPERLEAQLSGGRQEQGEDQSAPEQQKAQSEPRQEPGDPDEEKEKSATAPEESPSPEDRQKPPQESEAEESDLPLSPPQTPAKGPGIFEIIRQIFGF